MGLLLQSPEGDIITHAISYNFAVTNNEAEYEAVILGLEAAKELHMKHLQVFTDSLFVVNQFNGSFAIKDEQMQAYSWLLKGLAVSFDTFELNQVPRDQNGFTDALAGLRSSFKDYPNISVPIVHVVSPAISENDSLEVCLVNTDDTLDIQGRMHPYIEWLRDVVLPKDKAEAIRPKLELSG